MATAVTRVNGWVTFAAVVMFAVGFVRIISAFTYFDDGHNVNDLTNSIFGDNLWSAGLWDVVIAVLALVGGYSLVSGGDFGRVVAYVWAVVVIVQSFLTIEFVPWWSITMVALAAAVIYGLAHSGEVQGS